MFAINGADTSFNLSEEEPGSPGKDDPDENPDDVKQTFLSSNSGSSMQNSNLNWKHHVSEQQDDQVSPEHPNQVCAKVFPFPAEERRKTDVRLPAHD
jgi:hypothetical protein